MTTPTTPRPTEAKLHDTLFAVHRSIRYHRHRERFFDQTHHVGAVITMIAGIATVTALIADLPAEWAWTRLAAAALAMIASIANLGFNPAAAARRHSSLAMDFIFLEKDLVHARSAPLAKDLLKLQTRRLDIKAAEPPVLRVLDAICHDELITALDADSAYRSNVTRWQRLWRHFFDVGAHRLRTHAN